MAHDQTQAGSFFQERQEPGYEAVHSGVVRGVEGEGTAPLFLGPD